jgi:hypothetical protein
MEGEPLKQEDRAHQSEGRGDLHIHPVATQGWVGVVYIKGIKQMETEPFASIEEVERTVAERSGIGLRRFVWSQDSAMILSETRTVDTEALQLALTSEDDDASFVSYLAEHGSGVGVDDDGRVVRRDAQGKTIVIAENDGES